MILFVGIFEDGKVDKCSVLGVNIRWGGVSDTALRTNL